MKRRLVFLWFAVVLPFAIKAQSSDLDVFFEVGNASLSPKAQAEINSWWQAVGVANEGSLQLTGQADTNGSVRYNMALSERRTKAVADYLHQLGCTFQVEMKHVGEESEQPANLAFNRRVHLQFIYASVTELGNMNEFYEKTAKQAQHFIINPQRDTTLVGEEGTVLKIEAGTFAAKGKEPVVIELKEYYKFSDMLLENLSTTSNGHTLSTRGMLYVNATQNGKVLEPSKEFAIMMPTDNYSKKAKIFEGNREAHSDIMNWSLSNNSVLESFSITDFSNCRQYSYLLSNCRFKDDSTATLENCMKSSLLFCKTGLVGCKLCGRCCVFKLRLKRLGQGITNIFRFPAKWRYSAKQKIAYNNQIKNLMKKDDFTVDDVNELVAVLKKRKEEPISEKLTAQQKTLLKVARQIKTTDSLITNGQLTRYFGSECAKIERLMKKYKVDDVDALTLAVNKPLMDRFNVSSLQELKDTLTAYNKVKIESAYNSKNISYSDFKYYIFNSSTLGWKNCDIFSDIRDSQMVAANVDLQPGKNTDCKLVFTQRQFVLPGKPASNSYYFQKVPRGEKAWIVGIKYENGTPLLALQQVNIGHETYALTFKKRSIEQLKADLRVLDFQ
ncbi:OmpA family protein [bacterium]|nr:OmpA family protein [bacterium]